MSGPWIGPETPPWRTALCSYSLKPGEPHCTRDATWHGMMFDGDDVVPMECCDEHKPIVEALCDYVHPCGIPGSLFRWPENECITEWSEQSEFSQLVTAGAS